MFNTEQTASELHVSQSKLKRLAYKYQIKPRIIKGKAAYDQESIEALRLVRALQEEGRGDGTIRRKLDGVRTSPDGVHSQNELSPNQSERSPAQSEPGLTLVQVQSILKTEFSQQNELAEKYARATHEIGVLQERCRQFEEQIKALPSPETRYQLELQTSESERLLTELEQLTERLASIEAEKLEAESKIPKGFWAKLKMLFSR